MGGSCLQEQGGSRFLTYQNIQNHQGCPHTPSQIIEGHCYLSKHKHARHFERTPAGRIQPESTTDALHPMQDVSLYLLTQEVSSTTVQGCLLHTIPHTAWGVTILASNAKNLQNNIFLDVFFSTRFDFKELLLPYLITVENYCKN